MGRFKLVNVLIGAAIFVMALFYGLESRGEPDPSFNKGANGNTAVQVLGVVSAVAAYAVDSGHDVSPYVEMGKTYANSDHTIGGAGIVIDGRWDYKIGILGEGHTKNGEQVTTYFAGLSRIINPNLPSIFGCSPKSRIGMAYIPDSLLVGEVNYQMGFIADCKVLQIELGHYSSGGLFEENAGIDLLQIRMVF